MAGSASRSRCPSRPRTCPRNPRADRGSCLRHQSGPAIVLAGLGRSASGGPRCAPGGGRSCAGAACTRAAAASRGRGGADGGQRGSGSDQNFSAGGSSAARRRPRRRRGPSVGAMRMRFRNRVFVGVGSVSSVMTGISPVNSATVTASELPRRRRRRCRGRGAVCAVLGEQLGNRDGSGGVVDPVIFAPFRLARWLPASRTDVSTKAVPSASLSSFRKMRPSRSAHGQMSTVSIDSARILASATKAPATICGARSALTPSSSARSAVVILEMKDMSCLRPFAVSVRLTRGPAADGAAPVSRASDRKVFDVATARSGLPASIILAAASAISASSQSRSMPTRRRPGGSSASHSRVSRPAPSGSDIATSGSSSTPLDSSSEPPPMSRLMIRPALQPYQRRTARKVKRDSSTPRSTCSCTPSLADPREHIVGVLGVAHRRGGERHQLGAAGAVGDLFELLDRLDQLVGALTGDLAGVVD